MDPWVSATMRSRGVMCSSWAASSLRLKMKPTWGPLPWVMTTFQPWAIMSAMWRAVVRTASH